MKVGFSIFRDSVGKKLKLNKPIKLGLSVLIVYLLKFSQESYVKKKKKFLAGQNL